MKVLLIERGRKRIVEMWSMERAFFETRTINAVKPYSVGGRSGGQSWPQLKEKKKV